MTLFFAVSGFLLLALLGMGHLKLLRAIARPTPHRKPRPSYPSVTVIRPIRGLDPGCEENTLALLEQAYPGEQETVFVFDSTEDPAWPVVQRVVAGCKAGQRARLMTAPARPPQRTGKLNAMIAALAGARGELIAFNDSDTRPGPDLLRQLVDALLDDPEAGDTFAPVMTHGAPASAGDTGYALLVNAWYGPAAAQLLGPGDRMPFIMGEVMVFTRACLDAIGGLQCADGQLVDDMYLGQCVEKAGLKNVMVPWKLPMVTAQLGFADFLKLFRRWLLFAQGGLPFAFIRFNVVRGLEYGLACALAVAALALGQGWAALAPAAAAAFFVFSELSLQARFSGHRVPAQHWWMAVALPFIAGGVAIWTQLNHTVEWRGASYALDPKAKLSATAELKSAAR
jgi:ceramide glucosyltransferase